MLNLLNISVVVLHCVLLISYQFAFVLFWCPTLDRCPPTALTAGRLLLLLSNVIFFPLPCFHVFSLCLCSEEGPCSNLCWGSVWMAEEMQQCSHAGSTVCYSCALLVLAPKHWVGGGTSFSWSPCAHAHCFLKASSETTALPLSV